MKKYFPSVTHYSHVHSPVGTLTLLGSNLGLHGVLWESELENFSDFLASITRDDTLAIFVKTTKQLSEYFSKKRKDFDLDLVISGSDFQQKAWTTLRKIPYGKTISYGQQAEQMGDKKKARAVGMANGKNPLSIIIPCHRVIGSNGQLTGFGGGLKTKAFLLNLEGY